MILVNLPPAVERAVLQELVGGLGASSQKIGTYPIWHTAFLMVCHLRSSGIGRGFASSRALERPKGRAAIAVSKPVLGSIR